MALTVYRRVSIVGAGREKAARPWWPKVETMGTKPERRTTMTTWTMSPAVEEAARAWSRMSPKERAEEARKAAEESKARRERREHREAYALACKREGSR